MAGIFKQTKQMSGIVRVYAAIMLEQRHFFLSVSLSLGFAGVAFKMAENSFTDINFTVIF